MVKKSTVDGALYSRNGIQLSSSSLGYAPLDVTGPIVWQPGEPILPADDPTQPVMMPEPGTFSLLGSLLGGLLLLRRRRRRAA